MMAPATTAPMREPSEATRSTIVEVLREAAPSSMSIVRVFIVAATGAVKAVAGIYGFGILAMGPRISKMPKVKGHGVAAEGKNT